MGALSAAARDGAPLGAPAGLAPAPALTERALFELQKDADRIYAALAAVHSQERTGAAPEAARTAKRELAADLGGVLSQLPADASDWSALSSRLKDLRRERASVERAATESPEARSAGARRRAELNASIYALQLRAAYAQLMGGAPLPSPALRRNAALWSLVGAYNSAAAGRADAGWREGLDRAEAVFGDGRAVMVSRRWRNARTELDDAARDARNGRLERAADGFARVAGLLRRVPVNDAEHLARHRAAAELLDAAALAARGGEDGAELTARAEEAKNSIPHPKLPEPTLISYDALDQAARAQAHALDSAKADYLAVLAREASLSRWAQVLAGPRPSPSDRAAARADFQEARAWAGRGFVGPKQLAAQELDAALDALARGDDALAARHAGWARDELTRRRGDLERIASGLRARLHRLSRTSP